MGAGAAALVLLLWVTSSRSVRVMGPPQDPFDIHHHTIQPITPPPQPSGTPPSRTSIDMSRVHHGSTVFGVLFTIVAVLVAAAVVAAVVYYVYRLVRFRRERPRDAGFDTLPDVAAQVVDDRDAQLAALGHGQPRNAIVACWLRLEEAVAGAGLPRRPSETSAEFTTRVLAGLSVDAGAIHELARLYRVARFSTHDLGETDRDRAVAALRRLHDDLEQATCGSPGGPS